MKTKNKQANIALWTLFGALLLILFCGMRYGGAALSWRDFFVALTTRDGYETERLILLSRLPRVLGGALAGAGLAMSGLLLQAVTDNALAAPNIIGVNAGAGFAVALTLAVMPSGMPYVPLFAFGGAVLTTMGIVTLAGRHGRATVVLAGVAVTALLNAGISALTLMDTDLLTQYNAFSIGGFRGIQLASLPLPAGMMAMCYLAARIAVPQIDLFCLGDAGATVLGVPVRRVRILCILCASASAAAAVSFAGLLGFVGLITPHAARRLVGHRTAVLLPASAMLGAGITVLGDLIGRTVLAPTEIPVGIMMALIGAPFFLGLLMRRRREGGDV